MPSPRPAFVRRHPGVVGVIALLLVAVVGVGVVVIVRQEGADRAQQRLEAFYTPPSALPAGPPGALIRSEPLDIGPPGTRGWRVLYLSEDASGNARVSSGMVFAPTAPPPPGGYPVVAWAHGTVGMGEQCAPTRTADPLSQLTWLGGMIANGWVVAATDYAGLGTPGTLNYLVGADAAHDVLNAVRVARGLVPADTRFGVYGHSQGGASSLWTAELAATYAPELELVGVAAAAPAAELRALLNQQWDTPVGWAIGAEVLVGWPNAYPELEADQLTTRVGQRNYRRIAQECVLAAGLEGQARSAIRQRIFRMDPSTEPAWAARIDENTPRPLPAGTPVMVIQGLADTIVLPDTTALLVQRWCDAGSTLTAAWLGDQGHITLGKVGGPLATTWLQQRFSGVPATTTCGTSLPLAPASGS